MFIDEIPTAMLFQHEHDVGNFKKEAGLLPGRQSFPDFLQEFHGQFNVLQHMPAAEEVCIKMRILGGLVIRKWDYSGVLSDGPPRRGAGIKPNSVIPSFFAEQPQKVTRAASDFHHPLAMQVEPLDQLRSER